MTLTDQEIRDRADSLSQHYGNIGRYRIPDSGLPDIFGEEMPSTFQRILDQPAIHGFLTLLDNVADWGRLGAQTAAGLQDMIGGEAPEEAFEGVGQTLLDTLHPWTVAENTSPEQATQALDLALTFGGALPRWYEAIIPESPEASAAIMKTWSEKTGISALPWLAGFWNREFVAETLYDPLMLVDAFGLGVKAANAVGKIPKVSAMIRSIEGTDLYQRAYRSMGLVSHRMHEEWHPLRTRAQLEDVASHNRAADFLQAVDQEIGLDTWRKIYPDVTRIQETFGRDIEGGADAVRAVLRGTATDINTRMPNLAYNVEAYTEGQNFMRRVMREQFTDLPGDAVDVVADKTWYELMQAKTRPIQESIDRIPTRDVTDLEHILHVMHPDLVEHLQKIRGRTFAPELLEFAMPKALSLTLMKRRYRMAIHEMNDLAAQGRVFVNEKGSLRFVMPGKGVTAKRRPLYLYTLDQVTQRVEDTIKALSGRQIDERVARQLGIGRYDVGSRRLRIDDWDKAIEKIRKGDYLPDEVVKALDVEYNTYRPSTTGAERVAQAAEFERYGINIGDPPELRSFELYEALSPLRNERTRQKVFNAWRKSVAGAMGEAELGVAEVTARNLKKPIKSFEGGLGRWRYSGQGRIERAGVHGEAYYVYNAQGKQIGKGLDSFSNAEKVLSDSLPLAARTEAVLPAGIRAANKYEELVRAGKMDWDTAADIVQESGVRGADVADALRKTRPEKGWTEWREPILIDDPVMLSMKRDLRSTQATTASKFARTVAKRFGLKGAEAVDGVTFQNVMKRSEWERTVRRFPKDHPLKKIFTDVKFDSESTAKAALNYTNLLYGVQRNKTPYLKLYDSVISMWRGLTLTPFMPYHSRNTVGNILNNELAGIWNPVEYAEAALAMGRKGTREMQGFLKEAEGIGLFKQGQIRNITHGIMDDLYLSPMQGTVLESKWRRIVANTLDTRDERFWGQRVGTAIESHARFTHFAHMRRQGMSIKDAAKSVNKYLFDYTDVTLPVQLSKRVLAFPVWTMKNIPIQLEHLFTTPAKFARRGRMFAQNRRAAGAEATALMPEWIAEGAGVPIPGGDEEQQLYFRGENFDPAFTLAEMMDPFRMGYDMLLPFITEPIEQLAGTAKAQIGGPFSGQAKDIMALPVGEATEAVGFDPFFDRPIVRDYGEMPAWMQRADHVARSFLRMYGEISSIQRSVRRGETVDTLILRKILGTPIYPQDPGVSTHYALQHVNRQLARAEAIAARTGETTGLRDLYIRKLAILGTNSFAQEDPFSGQLRAWEPTDNPDSEIDVQGRRPYYQESIQTIWTLLTGAKGPTAMQMFDPLVTEESEEEFLLGLLDRTTHTYIMDVSQLRAAGAEVGERAEEYAEERGRYDVQRTQYRRGVL